MAKAQTSINVLGNDLDGQGDNKTQENIQNGEKVNDSPSAPEEEPKEKKRHAVKTKTAKKAGVKGITPQSPTVYLLPEEKSFIKRLEAHILLKTGESVTYHQLIMDAIREYVKKHHSDFKEIAS